MVRRRSLAVASALLAIAFLGVGCGGGDEGGERTQSDTTAAETVINDDDQALAEAIVLGLDDFPTGWRAEAPEENEGSIEDCGTFDFSDMTVTGRAESDEFASGNVSTVSSLALVFEEDAGSAFQQVASDDTAECLRDFIERRVKEDPPEGVTFGEISVGEISFPMVGEQSRAYEVVIEAEADGLSPNVYADLVFINVGRSLALLYFIDALTPFDNDMKVELSKKVASRM